MSSRGEPNQTMPWNVTQKTIIMIGEALHQTNDIKTIIAEYGSAGTHILSG